VDRLRAAGQCHLFKNLGRDKELDGKLLSQLERLDANYPGGIVEYINKSKVLLEKSKNGENPFDGYTPKVPRAFKFPFSATDKELEHAEVTGAKAFKKAACVLVAGGLGERLGYSGIKLELPSEITTGECFLGLYCKYILALQGDEVDVPLVIMTSDDTHDMTVSLLEREDYFGLKKTQITLLKQEKVASLSDIDATIAMKDEYTVLTKPHGHGDVHFLLHQSGLAKRWAQEGLEWVFCFQDTNPVSFRALPGALGVSVMNNLDVNSICSPRKAKAASGALMRLCHEDGHEITINVEYNYIDSILAPAGGDLNGPDGYSLYPGNMNQLIFALPSYAKTLERTGGSIPEFVNPKYANAERTVFKSPTRLECMMQDYPLTLKDAKEARIGVTVFADSQMEKSKYNVSSLTHRLYAPAKNNLKDGAKKALEGVPDATTSSTELAIYAGNALMLNDLGANVEAPGLTTYGGIEQPEWAHIVFRPSFVPLFSDLKYRFLKPRCVRITNRSTLVVNGGGVCFSGTVDIDGTLIVDAAPGALVTIQSIHIRNKGWTFAAVDPEDEKIDEIYRIRGYRIFPESSTSSITSTAHACVLRFDTPGTYTVDIPGTTA